MKILLQAVICGGFIGILAACGNKGATDSVSSAEKMNDTTVNKNEKKDAEFAVMAADGGLLEEQLGRLAQSNAASEQVRAFGKQMIDDHGAANNELEMIAQKKNIAIPESLSSDSKSTYDDLAKKKGADFDKAYCDAMVNDHKEDISLFKKEAEKGEDAELKSWAQNKLATLEHHLQMAEAAQKSVKGK